MKSIDFIGEKNGYKIACEIELNDVHKHLKDNILKCIHASEKFDKIIVAVYGRN